MLHEETAEASTLALIRRLMADENLADFYLVGGTELSLKLVTGFRSTLIFSPAKILTPLPFASFLKRYMA